jgi:hypothetical protein
MRSCPTRIMSMKTTFTPGHGVLARRLVAKLFAG